MHDSGNIILILCRGKLARQEIDIMSPELPRNSRSANSRPRTLPHHIADWDRWSIEQAWGVRGQTFLPVQQRDAFPNSVIRASLWARTHDHFANICEMCQWPPVPRFTTAHCGLLSQRVYASQARRSGRVARWLGDGNPPDTARTALCGYEHTLALSLSRCQYCSILGWGME